MLIKTTAGILIILFFTFCKKDKDTVTLHNINGMVYNSLQIVAWLMLQYIYKTGKGLTKVQLVAPMVILVLITVQKE